MRARTLVVGLLILVAATGCSSKSDASGDASIPKARSYADINQLVEAMNKAGYPCAGFQEAGPSASGVAQEGMCSNGTVLALYDTTGDQNNAGSTMCADLPHGDAVVMGDNHGNWTVVGRDLRGLQLKLGGYYCT